MRLVDGTLWPVPITLDVPEVLATTLEAGEHLALRDEEGVMVAALAVEDVWLADRQAEAVTVFGTADREYSDVAYLPDRTAAYYVGEKVTAIQKVPHYDYKRLRHTPSELRTEFARLGWAKVIAFQTRNPMHRAHQELTLRAAKDVGANLLIYPVVGLTKPGDIDHYTRVRCYQALLHRYPSRTALLSLLPLAMRMGGPREAVWHAIIRKNYGCTHLIVGRDHAGPGQDSRGVPLIMALMIRENSCASTKQRLASRWFRLRCWFMLRNSIHTYRLMKYRKESKYLTCQALNFGSVLLAGKIFRRGSRFLTLRRSYAAVILQGNSRDSLCFYGSVRFREVDDCERDLGEIT